MPPPPAPPPPEIRPQTHEYNWPASDGDSSATVFSIVSNDHRVHSAVAVWVQGKVACYVAPDGGSGRIPIDSIDRKATRQRNPTDAMAACRELKQAGD